MKDAGFGGSRLGYSKPGVITLHEPGLQQQGRFGYQSDEEEPITSEIR